MTKQTEALKLALEAAYLAGFNASGEGYNGEYPFDQVVYTPVENRVWKKDRDNYIKEALSQPEQEPVANGYVFVAISILEKLGINKAVIDTIATTPPQRKPLTELQLRKIASSLRIGFTWFEFAQAIEAASTTTVNPSNHAGFEKLSGEFSTTVLEPEQEPVYQIKVYGSQTAWHDAGSSAYDLTSPNERRILYTTSPQRKPLTVEQRREISKALRGRNWRLGDAIDAVEAAHGIKRDA